MVLGSWISKEDKICDPKGSNTFSFTGFRINRHVTIDGIPPKVINFITISHCKKGKVDYEKHMRVDTNRDAIWNRPFCIIKEKDDPDFIFVPEENNDQNKNITNTAYGKLRGKLSNSKEKNKKYWKSLIKYYSEYKLSMLTENLPIHYTGEATRMNNGNIGNQTIGTILKELSKDVECFKLARRKKYAKNDISYYMPNSFVGAMFECPITDDKKKELLEKISVESFLSAFEFDCDESVSRPIFPIIADDMSNYWIEKRVISFNPQITQKIPYLSSASPLNLRFAINETPDISKDTWAKDIDVNENYDYSNFELNHISKAISLTANFVNKMLFPNVLYKILGTQKGIIRPNTLENPELGEKDYLLNKIKNYTSNEKLDLLFISMSKRADISNLLRKIDLIWNIPIKD